MSLPPSDSNAANSPSASARRPPPSRSPSPAASSTRRCEFPRARPAPSLRLPESPTPTDRPVFSRQVDVLINHVWFEGLVTKVHRESQITVAFPGADGADSARSWCLPTRAETCGRERRSTRRSPSARGYAEDGPSRARSAVSGWCAGRRARRRSPPTAATARRARFLRGEAPSAAAPRPRRRPRRRRDVRPRGIVTLRVLRWRWRRNGARV